MAKHLSYATINSLNRLYFIINEINGYIEESNGNNYLMLNPTDRNKHMLNKYEELWNKNRHLIRSITNNSDNYEQKYMKIKFNSDNDLSPKKMQKLYNMVIVVRFIFHEGNKYYPLVFLEERLYKLLMLEYNRIDVLEEIDVNKTNGLHECIICHNWYVLG